MRLWDVATGQCLRAFDNPSRGENISVCLSSDSRWALSSSGDLSGNGPVSLWELDWDFEEREPADWNEGARFVLENFLTLHTPYAAELPKDRKPTDNEITRALTRSGTPSWNEGDIKGLLYMLACAGFGWLKPEGVRRELMNMAASLEENAHPKSPEPFPG